VVRTVSIVTATLLFCYITLAIFFLRDSKDVGNCHNVQIVVTDSLDKHFVSDLDVLTMIKHSGLNPVNKPMNRINTFRLEKALLKNEMIAQVAAYKTPSGTIRLEIAQKIPILRIISPQGNYYIDNLGTTMPISTRYVADVPIASGNIEKRFAITNLYKFALFLQSDDFWNDQIEQIYVNQNNDVELIPRVGEQVIMLGSFENFEEKLANLKLFYDQAVPKVGWDKYSIINLKYKDQIVCTKK